MAAGSIRRDHSRPGTAEETSVSGGVPGSAAISGLVGIAGIVGGIVTHHLTNRAAERRLQLEQQQTDRTRFHDMRVEMYGKLLAAAQNSREVAAALRPLAKVRPDQLTDEQKQTVLAPLRNSMRKLTEASQMVELVATSATREAAKALIEKAVFLSVLGFAGDEEFDTRSKQLADAEYAFAQTARGELLPPETAPPPTQ